jgi:hypothetical protein
MTIEADVLEIESERVYVVYDARTGAIAHVHRVVTHRGATRQTADQNEKRALELASRFGHRIDRMRVLHAEKFDGGVLQKVDVKAGRLVPENLKASRRTAPRKAAKKSKTTARRKGRA